MDRKNGCTNKTIPKIYSARPNKDIHAQKGVKGPYYGQNGGTKYKIFNF